VARELTQTTSQGAQHQRFEDWVLGLDAKQFDALADAKLAELEQPGGRLDFNFRRMASSDKSSGTARAFRQDVARIPVMDRGEEQRFAMGIELLFERLKRTRREAQFDAEAVDHWPDAADTRCLDCAPGDELDCFGCAPGDCTAAIRAQLRDRTQDLVLVRNEMVARHLYIVFRLVDRYRHAGVPVDDMIQDGNESLFRAVQGFDFRRGVRFKTYATYWVNQAILNAIYNQSRTVRVPAYIQKAMKKIGEAAPQVEGGLHNIEGLSAATEVEPRLVQNTLRGNRYTLSLNRPADGEGGTEMVDFVEASADSRPRADRGEGHALERHLGEAVSRLSEREQTVIGMRFGLSGDGIRTLAEVGRKLGVSLERVRQIQRAALEKLRVGVKGPSLEQFV
jgi:RNA polymerase sigma factor (sigma-70 family)